MLFQCERCGNEYTNKIWAWCRQCQINSLKNYTTICNNEKLNNFIQEMQLKIDAPLDIVFEWIPYDQFNDINEINGFTYAIWKDGRLKYDLLTKKYQRNQDMEVSLKYSHN